MVLGAATPLAKPWLPFIMGLPPAIRPQVQFCSGPDLRRLDTTANYDIKWKIATDTAMINVIDSGIVNTDASTDFTVNVDVTGLSGGTTVLLCFRRKRTILAHR